MATTIINAFTELRSRLEITGLQAATVSTRQQNVRAAVEDGLKVLETYVIGSYMRNTMIAPLKNADVDILVVLSVDHFQQHGQATLLDTLRTVLKRRYPETPRISRNGQAVTIQFTDFHVDVVPAFNRKGGGYLIPDSTRGQWISTDPLMHITTWSARNQAHKGDLVPLLKMLKAWNRAHSGLLTSFHLETLALTILTNVTISNFPSGMRYVFDKARSLIQAPLVDPAGYSGDVGAYLDTAQKRQAVRERLDHAYTQAVEAERLATNESIQAAFGKWSTIFGSDFPAYG